MVLVGVFLRPLVPGSFLLVLFLPEKYNTWTFVGNDFQVDAVFRSFFGLTVDTCFCQSTCRSRRLRSTRKLGFLLELTSGLVPGFSLCLVRKRIHIASVYVLVSSPEEYEGIGIFSGRPLLDLFPYSALFGSTVILVGVSL